MGIDSATWLHIAPFPAVLVEWPPTFTSPAQKYREKFDAKRPLLEYTPILREVANAPTQETRMTYDDLIALITPTWRKDWLQDDQRSIYTLKSDVNVTIREVKEEEPSPFQTESWATNFPDRKAVTLVFELWYGASYVKEYYFAAVDGLRALLPYPKSKDELVITREEYAIAQAVNMQNRLDEYLVRAGIKIVANNATRPLSPVC